MAKQVLVAEGDSWFALSEKKLLKAGGIKRTDVINELKKLGYDIESVADISDKIESMAYSEDQLDRFKEEIEELNKPPHAILLSGGGNDVTGRALEMMLKHKKSHSYSPSKPFNEDVVRGVIEGHLHETYLKLLKEIDAFCKEKFNNTNQGKIPVLIHGYAYPIPDGRGFANKKSEGNLLFGLFDLLDPLIEMDIPGPWLQPAFRNKGYFRLKVTTDIMKKLIDRFNCMLNPYNS